MNKLLQRLAPAMAALCLPLGTAAQAQGGDPADARALGQALRYRSAFAGHTPWQDLGPGDWRAANAKVRDPAGHGDAHAGHHGAAPAPSGGALPAAAAGRSGPPASGHGAHPRHGGEQ